MLTLISFGYLHLTSGPPLADRVDDVRRRLRDPAAAQQILGLDGRDPRVQRVVESTPGAQDLLNNLVDYVELLRDAGDRRIAVGCAGGRHRAPSLVELLAQRLGERGHQVAVDHRHIHLPRVLHATGQDADETAARWPA